MGSRGDAYDNAVAVEMSFATLKKEFFNRRSSLSRFDSRSQPWAPLHHAFYTASAATHPWVASRSE